MALALHIVLVQPPAGIDFGLQKGSGTKFETIGIQRSAIGNMHFTLSVETKGEKQAGALPDFKGPFVQGTAEYRFIYIRIGSLAGQHTHWCRRLKIPLTGITWVDVGEAGANPGAVLETHVPGTGRDGGPNCATVKPFEGWKIKREN